MFQNSRDFVTLKKNTKLVDDTQNHLMTHKITLFYLINNFAALYASESWIRLSVSDSNSNFGMLECLSVALSTMMQTQNFCTKFQNPHTFPSW